MLGKTLEDAPSRQVGLKFCAKSNIGETLAIPRSPPSSKQLGKALSRHMKFQIQISGSGESNIMICTWNLVSRPHFEVMTHEHMWYKAKDSQ